MGLLPGCCAKESRRGQGPRGAQGQGAVCHSPPLCSRGAAPRWGGVCQPQVVGRGALRRVLQPGWLSPRQVGVGF